MRFLCLYEIRKRQQVYLDFFDGDRRSSLPQHWKWIDASHHCHDIDSESFDPRGTTTKVDVMPTIEI